MHNKPYSVDASKIQRVLPDLSYISLQDSARAAADSAVALGLVSMRWSPRLLFLDAFGRAYGALVGQRDPLLTAQPHAAAAAEGSPSAGRGRAGCVPAAARSVPLAIKTATAAAAAAADAGDTEGSEVEAVSTPVSKLGVNVIVCEPVQPAKQHKQQPRQQLRQRAPAAGGRQAV